jgi:hypothetical protein
LDFILAIIKSLSFNLKKFPGRTGKVFVSPITLLNVGDIEDKDLVQIEVVPLIDNKFKKPNFIYLFILPETSPLTITVILAEGKVMFGLMIWSLGSSHLVILPVKINPISSLPKNTR